MVRAILITIGVFVLLAGAFVLMTMPSELYGTPSASRPLAPGMLLVEFESSSSRTNLSNELNPAIDAAVSTVIVDEAERREALRGSGAASANYIIYNRLKGDYALQLKADEQQPAIVSAMKAALQKSFGKDRLKVTAEYQPLDRKSPVVSESFETAP